MNFKNVNTLVCIILSFPNAGINVLFMEDRAQQQNIYNGSNN